VPHAIYLHAYPRGEYSDRFRHDFLVYGGEGGEDRRDDNDVTRATVIEPETILLFPSATVSPSPNQKTRERTFIFDRDDDDCDGTKAVVTAAAAAKSESTRT